MGYKPHPLGRLFLSLHILPESLDRRTASRRSEVAGSPEVSTTGCQFWELLAQHPAAHTLEVVHQRRHRERRRVLDQQVHMVRLAVELQQLEAHLLGDTQTDRLHPVQRSTAQGLAPILHDEHQVNDKPRNAVPASPERWLRHCTPTLV